MRKSHVPWLLASVLSVACGSDEQVASSSATGGASGSAGAAGASGGKGGGPGSGGASTGGGGATATGGSAGSGVGFDGGADSGAGPGDAGSDGDASTDSPSAPVPALSVSAIDTYVTETDEIVQPVDLSQYDLSVLVYDGASSAYSSFPPVVTGPGKFKIDTLPPGERYVRYSKLGAAPIYYVTTSDTLDLGAARFGRPNLKKSAAGTTLVLNVTKAEAWQDGDLLQFFSLGGGTVGLDLLATSPPGAPAVSDTALTSLTLDYRSLTAANLIDGNAGDRAHLTELAQRSLAGGGSYLAVSRLFSMPPFSMTDGATTTITGEFVTVPTTTLSVDYKASQFESAATSCNPSATILGRVVGASSQPAAKYGSFSPSLDMLQYVAPDATDLVTTFTFGDPFSPKWTLFVAAATYWVRDYALPSTTPASPIGRVEIRVLPSGATTVAPLVGCVKNPTIGGQDAQSDVAGVGKTPTVTFGAPTVGTAAGYNVDFHRLVDNAGETVRVLAGRIVTTGTTVIVPPGILSPGNVYTITLRALSVGVDLNRRPQAMTFPGGAAEMLGGTVAP